MRKILTVVLATGRYHSRGGGIDVFSLYAPIDCIGFVFVH